MQRERLTPGRISKFSCPVDAKQSFLWDTDAPRLAVRATTGAKSFIFQAKKGGETIRVTIGDIRNWPLDALRDRAGEPTGPGAREEANRLQHIVMAGRDPRIVKANTLAAEDATREASAVQRVVRSSQRNKPISVPAYSRFGSDG